MLLIMQKISEVMVPFVVLYIVLYAVLGKRNVFGDFIEGASRGVPTVLKILPTLVGILIAVRVLRDSGMLEDFGKWLQPVLLNSKIQSDFIPLVLIRMFSSSAATGLTLDIFKKYGTDSYMGMLASITMSCTETIFYTMSIYFMAAKVTKTRWTLAGALFSTIAGVIASVVLAKNV